MTCKPEAAAEALLLGLGRGRVRGLRLVGSPARLLFVALGRLRAALKLLERLLVERNARGMSVARRALRKQLLLLLAVSWLRDAGGDLLRRRLLLLLVLGELVGRWVSARARLVDSECFADQPHDSLGRQPATYWIQAPKALATGVRTRFRQTSASDSTYSRGAKALQRSARELPE